MSDDGVSVTVKGIPDFREALLSIPRKLRRRALLNALRKGARVIQAEARNKAPVLTLRNYLRAPFRKPGTVRNAIAVRTSKLARQAGDVGVFVNVRPAKGGNRGAKSPSDPFYWKFLEFGTKKMPARPFLRPAAQKLAEALKVIEDDLGPQIQRLNSNPKDEL